MTPEKSGLSTRQKQSKLFGIMMGLGVFLAAIAIMAVIPVTPYASYTNPTAGVRLRYPEAWKMVDQLGAPGAIVAFVAPQQTAMDTYAENVNVTFQDISSSMSVSQFNQLAISQFKGTFKKDVEVVTSEPTKLDGRPAYRFGYIMKGESNLRMMHVWVLNGTRAYIITYGATEKDFDAFYSQAEFIIKSFKIL